MWFLLYTLLSVETVGIEQRQRETSTKKRNKKIKKKTKKNVGNFNESKIEIEKISSFKKEYEKKMEIKTSCIVWS